MKIINKFGGRTIGIILSSLMLLSIFIFKITILRNGTTYKDNYINLSVTDEKGMIYNDETSDAKIQSIPITIFAKDNFQDYQVNFFIPHDSTVHVKAVGEAADYSSNPYLFNSWDNDGIEMYFHLRPSKSQLFDLTGSDRQFRISWKSNQVSGKNINTTGVIIKESDPTSTLYTIDISLPWKTLGYVEPKTGTRFGFDAAILDCDSGAQKGKLTWHSKNDENWRITSNYGTMMLVNKSAPSKASDYAFIKRRSTPSPGAFSPFSNTATFYTCKNVTVGFIKDSADLSGKFRAEWDKRNLYIQFCVRDNIKTLASTLFDYGWIENSSGDIIWKMNMKDLKYAGGAFKNKFIDTTVNLKRGYYVLRYHTDESHSSGKWDATPPTIPFYGIMLDYKTNGRQTK